MVSGKGKKEVRASPSLRAERNRRAFVPIGEQCLDLFMDLPYIIDLMAPKKKPAKAIAAELHQGIKDMRKTFHGADARHAARFTARVELSIPKSGFERNTIRRLLITFGRTKDASAVPFALHVKLEVAT